jgi:integrase
MATPEKLNNPIIKKSAAPETTPLNVINKLGQETWVIINKSDNVEMKLHFSAMNERERLWAQQLLLSGFPYTDARQTLRYAHGTLVNMVQSIRRVLVYLQEQSDDKKQLQNWTVGDAGKMIQSLAVKEGSLLSSGIPRAAVKVLKESYSARYQQDGISFALPATFLQKVMPPILKQFDMTYSQWEKGGSHGMLPMPVATLLLADAIKLIRSKECQLLQCYFTSFRKGLLSRAMIVNRDKRLTIGKSIFNCDISQFLKPSKDNPLTGVNVHAKADKKRADFVKNLHKIDPELSDFPFKSQIQITEFVNEIEGACLTILLAVTGMRLSECHSIGADWMDAIDYLDVNGVWTKDAILKSKIIKTGGGIIAKRGLSPLGIETFELLNTLSWVDKEKLGLQLFAYTYAGVWLNKNTDTYKATVPLNRLRAKLKNYYQKFVERAHHSVKEAFPDIVPHNLRHLKMAFGLRKFDGNVEEAIKQEFRHHGHHTQSYARNKLNETQAALVRRTYAEDIIKRILINDPSDKWAGPLAKKIRDLAKKLLHGLDIEMLSLEALANFHEEIHENIHSMIMHSYGLCFVLKDSVHVAKCGVKDSVVRTGTANSKLCHGCANFCVNNKSHEHDMAMNKRRWNATANSELIASFPIVKEAKAMVKKIEQLEAELLEASDE